MRVVIWGAFVDSGNQARTLILLMTGDLHLALSRLSRNRASVIAAVNGTAAGAGFSLAMAAGMATAPTEAYAQVKRLLDSSFSQSLETRMELEARAIAAQVASVGGQEGMQAFVEKRKPQFRGV